MIFSAPGELPWPDLDGANIGIAHATIATLGTILFVGLAFLARPRRSTLLWSLTFMGIMVACYGYLAATAAESEELRRGSMGLLLGAPALLWSGLRAHRKVRTYAWISALVAAASILALLAPGESAWFGLAYRVMFFVSGIFGVLFLLEWRRIPERSERLLWPIVVASAGYALAGVTVLIGALFTPLSTAEAFASTRIFNSIGMLVYMVCALVSLVPLVTPGSRAIESSAPQGDWDGPRASRTCGSAGCRHLVAPAHRTRRRRRPARGGRPGDLRSAPSRHPGARHCRLPDGCRHRDRPRQRSHRADLAPRGSHPGPRTGCAEANRRA